MPDNLLDELLSSDAPTVNLKNDEDKELAPLLEELNLIVDDDIRTFVRAVLLKLDSFWVIPSSFSGKYHPPDERGPGGNVLHTKRVVRTVRIIAEAQERTLEETDVLTAAAILHDVTKGSEAGGELMYDHMHPYTVDQLVEWARMDDKTNGVEGASVSLWLPMETIGQILRLVRTHMGIWSPIPETIPISSMEWALHYADLIASRLHNIVDGEEINEQRWTTPSQPPGDGS